MRRIMLGEVFQKILDMSLIGCYSIFIVMAVRLVLSKCERKYIYYLWFVVFLNLCIPFSFRGVFSLIPSPVAEFSVTNAVESVLEGKEAGSRVEGSLEGGQGTTNGTITPQQLGTVLDGANAGLVSADGTNVDPISPDGDTDGSSYLPKTPAETALPLPMRIAAGIWLAGIGVLLLWSLAGAIRLKKQVSRENWIRISRKKGIVQVADLDTPFLWGIFRPMIYLPTDLETEEMRYVVAHEQYHKKRKDYLIKIAVFFVVAIHWFNPFVWAAYSLFCRDMEISCDEAVILQFKGNIRKQYAGSLLKYAARQSGFVLSPITFGEPAVKSRIKNVLRFKRRGIVLSVLTILCVASVAVGLVLRPSAETAWNEPGGGNQSDPFENGGEPSDGNNGNLDGENGNPQPSSVESFKAILLENGSFLNADLQSQEFSLANIGKVVTDDDSITVGVDKFTIIDLDGDGEDEIVLWIQVNGVVDYGFEVLHYQDGTVYGSTLPYRAFMDLKADGTFLYSSGAADSGVGRLKFAEDGRAIVEELNDDVDYQEEKTDVAWFDLSADNVNMAFGNLSYPGYVSGVSGDGEVNVGGETDTVGESNADGDVNTDGIMNTGGEAYADSWYGSYIVTDYVMEGVNALGDEGAKNWINHTVEYGQDRFASNEAILEDPVYNEAFVGKEEFEVSWRGSGGGYSFDILGIGENSLLEVTIDNYYEFGNLFYVRDDGKILIPWYGVFFIAERR